jgi:hypothetical protein
MRMSYDPVCESGPGHHLDCANFCAHPTDRWAQLRTASHMLRSRLSCFVSAVTLKTGGLFCVARLPWLQEAECTAYQRWSTKIMRIAAASSVQLRSRQSTGTESGDVNIAADGFPRGKKQLKARMDAPFKLCSNRNLISTNEQLSIPLVE